jgi:hypothetical protein
MTESGLIDMVSAVASCATALFTGGLLYVATTQTRALRDENRKWETVRACNKYITDPVLYDCAGKVRQASQGSDYSLAAMRPVLQEIRAIINYFDSLAIGVAQGVYVDKIVEDNLSLVIEFAVDKFLLPEFDGEMNFAGLAHLIALRNSWRANPAPRFRSAL